MCVLILITQLFNLKKLTILYPFKIKLNDIRWLCDTLYEEIKI